MCIKLRQKVSRAWGRSARGHGIRALTSNANELLDIFRIEDESWTGCKPTVDANHAKRTLLRTPPNICKCMMLIPAATPERT
eukprot:4909414-Pleurochrysis_carterae.AAC.3